MFIIKKSKFSDLKKFTGDKKDLETIRELLSLVNLKSGKAPRGMTKEYEILKSLKNQIDTLDKFYDGDISKSSNLISTISYFIEKLDGKIDLLISKLSSDKEVELKLKNATFINESTMSEKNFKEQSKYIDGFLSTLKGFHKKVLKDLIIVFVKKEQSKASATYKTREDKIFIRPDKVIKGDAYASFVYVVMHELGHRYLQKNNVKWNYDSVEWITTKYSMTDSFSGEEKFAELFALSHFKYSGKPFSDYNEKIKKFESQMEK